MASLSICDDERYLQQEPWAFRHEREGHHRGDTGERADDDKHSPTVELVGWAHAEAPPWERKTGGVRQSEDPSHGERPYLALRTGQILPPPGEQADLGISHSDQLNLKMASNSAEKKGVCNQLGLGLGMEVHVYISGQASCKDQGKWIWGSAFSSRLLGWVSPACSLRLVWTLVSAVSQETALRGPHQLDALSISFRLGLNNGSTGRRTEGGIRAQDVCSPYSLLPSPWLRGGLTVNALVPGNLPVEPRLLSSSGSPTLLLTSEA